MIRSTPGREPNKTPIVDMVALSRLGHKCPVTGAPSVLNEGDEFKLHESDAVTLEAGGQAKRKAKPAPLPPKPAKASKKGGK